MSEARPRAACGAVAGSVRAVPTVIGDGIGLLRASRVLLALVAVELFWGFSMVTFESLFPVRLSEVVGDTEQAAALMGPVSSVAWFASAAGAAVVVLVSNRIGVARSAALLRIVQGLTIVAMGLLAGPIGVVTAYLACYVAHGASNPMHMTLLHRQVDGPHRTTVLSMNSMVVAAGRGDRGDRPGGPRRRDVDRDRDGRRRHHLRRWPRRSTSRPGAPSGRARRRSTASLPRPDPTS